MKNKRRCDYKSTLYVCIASANKSDANSSCHLQIVSFVIMYTMFGLCFFVGLWYLLGDGAILLINNIAFVWNIFWVI